MQRSIIIASCLLLTGAVTDADYFAWRVQRPSSDVERAWLQEAVGRIVAALPMDGTCFLRNEKAERISLSATPHGLVPDHSWSIGCSSAVLDSVILQFAPWPFVPPTIVSTDDPNGLARLQERGDSVLLLEPTLVVRASTSPPP